MERKKIGTETNIIREMLYHHPTTAVLEQTSREMLYHVFHNSVLKQTSEEMLYRNSTSILKQTSGEMLHILVHKHIRQRPTTTASFVETGTNNIDSYHLHDHPWVLKQTSSPFNREMLYQTSNHRTNRYYSIACNRERVGGEHQ
mmetsp:Transcript_10064/g.11505  ORF Transcript_10064/g.11505 Transcript_10064/m.11505 type:complete len:144 (-) Transcript_10064:66-497(-)